MQSFVRRLRRGRWRASESDLPSEALSGPNTTSFTVYNDQPLRWHRLTLSAPELTSLEDADIEGFKIRISGRSGRRDAHALVARRYRERDYRVPADRAHPHRSTFLAYDEGRVVGTVSVGLEGEGGLPADDIYKEELEALRAGGAQPCEFMRLAVAPHVPSRPVLASLFHVAYLYASAVRGCTHGVIEVHPRHVSFYRRALGFSVAGAPKHNGEVNAPAVLLCVPFSAIAAATRQHALDVDELPASRPFLARGFSPEEASGVLGRLQRSAAADTRISAGSRA